MEKTRRVVLVTGGVGGIGTAICKRLAHDGHFVVANYAIPGSEDKWNTAITRDSTFRKMTPEQWRAVISTNLDSVFNVTRHVIDGMVERGWGRIVNISSVNAVRGQFGQTNYASAKAGILGFTKSLAQEVVRKGVTVNAISPGYVQTDMVMAIREDVREKIVSEIPAGRLAMPEEIADAVAFLASENAAYITGTNLSVNGGLHMYA
jgi:acetoacetyl-CoA reductase